MRITLKPLLIALTLPAAACHGPFFQNDLIFERPGKKHRFTIAVTNDTLYVYGKFNGEDISGISGRSMKGKEIFHAAAADLDSDGNPEVYVFYRPQDIGPGVIAATCRGKICSPIGAEGSAGGPRLTDYCGGDSYTVGKDSVLRSYASCSKSPSGDSSATHEIRYRLKHLASGDILAETDK